MSVRIHQVEKHSLVKIDYILVRIRSLSLILSPTLLAQLCDSLSARQFTPGRSSQSQVTRQTDRQANETTAPGGIRIHSCDSIVYKLSNFQPKIMRCEEKKRKPVTHPQGKKSHKICLWGGPEGELGRQGNLRAAATKSTTRREGNETVLKGIGVWWQRLCK